MSLRNNWRTQALLRWQRLSAREQQRLSVWGTLLLVASLAWVAIAPALQTLRNSEQHRTELALQHSRMRTLQTQAQALQTRTPLSHEEALRTLQGLTPGTHMQLQVQGEQVSVQLKTIPASTLARWLTQARTQAQALPVEAHLTRSPSTGTTPGVAWEGQLVLRLPHRNATTP